MLSNEAEDSNSIINGLGLPEVNLNDSSKILEALQKNRGFIIELADGTDAVAEQLFQNFNQFIQAPNEYKDKFKGENTSNTKGYYEDPIVNGNKVGPRFFIQRDRDNKTTQPLPAFTDGPGMEELSERLHERLQPIIDKTIHVLEEAYNFKKDELKSQFFCSSATSIHHHRPVTREKLQQWLTNKQLTKTETGKIEAMMQHKDLVGLTVLIYRHNNAKGLEIKIKNQHTKTYTPIELPASNGKLKALIILGRLVNKIIPSLQGLSHRVIATPLKPDNIFSRDVINLFVLPDMQAQLSKTTEPYTAGNFFPEIFKLYEQRREQKAEQTLCAEELNNFPQESDIEVLNMPTGISYKLKSC